MSMMKSLPLLLILFAAARAATPPYSCSAADPQIQHLPFCNRTLPTLSRARDLVSRLTLDEKIAQLVNTADAVPRLGVPAFQWWSEALHGVAGAGKGIHFNRGRIKAATSFPQVILSAASFDAYLWYRIGQQWRFNGYITSDCDAVAIIYESHKYTKTPEDAAADVLKAGMDIDCGLYLKKHTKSAVQQKKLATSDIDRALRNLFAVRMRLGLFNGDPRNLPFGKIGPTEVCSQEHQNLALEAARHGIVLLKNDAKLLPLPKSNAISLAVIGPQANADNATTLQGNYYGPPCKSATPLQALKSYVKNIKYQTGCNDVACGYLDAGPALSLAKEVDYVVLVMGLDQGQEAESRDRYSLLLPGNQQKLIISVADIAKKPVVLVLLSGGPVDITFAKNHPKIGGILWAGYPGEAGGTAIAEIIFGDHNPGSLLLTGHHVFSDEILLLAADTSISQTLATYTNQ
uniref:Glycoside hydrolase family 3 C-terminal domain-containing protein n=1 Tax=Kalanchoe fedtschenkoi TaxID=63787 RepID=A0A7N0V939_KALFE